MASIFGGTSVPSKYQATVLAAAAQYGMPPAILAAQINAESSFNPGAVSPDGAIGISQFLPGTAKSVGLDPHDPVASIKAQAKLMSYYYRQYGSWEKALYAYHDGPGKVNDPGPAGIAYAKEILGVVGQDVSGSVAATPVVNDPLSSVEGLIDRFADPDAWKRVGYYALGFLLVVAGIVLLVMKEAPTGIASVLNTGGKGGSHGPT